MTQVSGDPSYYEVLGVAPTATADEVKSAYRRLSRQIHPDVGGNGALFRLVSAAYETLSDPDQRAAYDRSLNEGPRPSSPPPETERRKEDVTSNWQPQYRSAPPPRPAVAVHRRRIVAGAALGGLWYLLRATGFLSWAMGYRAAGRWLPREIDSWAQPFTLGKLLLCLVIGGVGAYSHRLSRVAKWVSSMRSGWAYGAVAGLLITSALMLEYLVSAQGRTAVVVGIIVASISSELLSRPRSATSDP